MRLVVWGAGELGTRVLARWVAAGHDAIGYTRTDKRHDLVRATGATARKGSPGKQLRDDDILLLAISGSANQFEALASLERECPRAAVLISSVGFYGNPHGVTNEQTPAGDSPHATRIAKTESAFAHWAQERGTILRLGGLYRPGRGPMSALCRRGAPPPGPPDRTLALIHYEDAANAALAAVQSAPPERLYVGVTTPCPTREEFYRTACERAGLPAPNFTERFDKPLAEYDVTLLRRDLLPAPAFPNWHSATDLPEGDT
ncbi:MAG: hypothetical protein K0U93_29090 [Gammaproteobacteria bacterium]|nr:hypothetical protein [Gammaproteobacteria bacterium]